MPERGGPTTESGILYQNTVAALYMGRLLDTLPRRNRDQVVAVRVEAPQPVDDTVVTFADGHHAYIQSKENLRATHEAWATLWHDFAEQYQEIGFQRGIDRLVLHIGESHDEHHALREMCNRACGSQSYVEWWDRLTKGQQQLLMGIKPLIRSATPDDDTLLSFFSHINVEIVPLTELERTRVPDWMPASTAPPHTLFGLLRDRVGGKARMRGTFKLDQLRQELETDDHVFLILAPSITQLQEAVRACGALLRQHKNTLGKTGRHVARSVVHDIVAWASGTTDKQQVAMLLDSAGMGKTVVMRDVLHALEARGVAILAIKADQQLSGITALADLPNRLNLPDSVERVVAGLAAVGPTVVLIDQIDALSLSLAHDQYALDVALDLVVRLRAATKVPILLSCRIFDRNTDPRLRRLTVDREFAVQEFTKDDVRAVIQDLGMVYDTLSPATQILLRVPLHLDLFAMLPWGQTTQRHDAHGITTLQDLYSRLWRDVVLAPGPGSPPVAERVDIVRCLTDYMDHAQRTSAPQALFTTPETAHLEQAVRWLASTGILVQGEVHWTFLHQTFFDYCYARYFVEGGHRLASTILAGDQGLFARPQLVHVLAYLRGYDPLACLGELSTLMGSPDLRYHLQDLLLNWFGALANPTDEEWTVARRWLLNPTLRPRLLLAMKGNAAWFTRMRGSALQGLLALHDDVVDTQVLPYIASLLDVAQVEIVTTLQPRLGSSDRWTNRIVWLLAQLRTGHTTEAINLIEQTLHVAPAEQNNLISSLAEITAASPRDACRLLRLVLDLVLDEYLARRAAALARLAREQEPVSLPLTLSSALDGLRGQTIDTAISVAADAEPQVFITTLLPWLERALGPVIDRPLYYAYDDLAHGWHSRVYAVQERLLSAFIASLTALSRTDADEFHRIATRLAAVPARTPQQLLALVYQAVPDLYADDALDFLLADRRRLDLGEHEQFDTRQLITATYPFLTAARQAGLEDYIITTTRNWKVSRTEHLRWSGLDTLYLLQAIPGGPSTARGVQTLRELKRKFPNQRAESARITMTGGYVGPPISLDAATRMADRAWLHAMRMYHGAAQHRDFLKGGARELAGVLRHAVKAQPERFHRLALRMPDDVDVAYIEAFVMGLADAGTPANLLFDVVRRFRIRDEPDLRTTIARALEQYVETGLPEDLIALLDSWAHDQPATLHEDGKDPYSTYINSNSGAALHTLMRSLDQQGTAAAQAHKWLLLEDLATSASTALRSGVIEWLLYTLHEDRDHAVTLFEKTTEGRPALLRSHYTQDFLYHGIYQHFARMIPFIRALMEEEEEEHQQRGAELACIAALSSGVLGSPQAQAAAQKMEQEVLTGRTSWRRGAARIYAHNLAHDAAGVSERGLLALLNDEDETVRRLIGETFPLLREDHIITLRPFLERYAASRSVQEGTHQFTEYLWKQGALDPPWALSMASTILDNASVHPGVTWAAGGEKLIRLVLRTYTGPTVDGSTRRWAMDLFDRLMEHYTGAAQNALSEWDRR